MVSFAQRQELASAAARAARREQLGLPPDPNNTIGRPGAQAQVRAVDNQIAAANPEIFTPPKADAARTGAGKYTGLAEALNRYQRQLVQEGKIEVADEYEIEFIPKELGDSLVVKAGTPDHASTPLQSWTTAKDKLDPETQSVGNEARTASLHAGMSILQFIDQQVRNSSYVMDQSSIIYDEVTFKPIKRSPIGQIAWFKISATATPIVGKVDKKRKDFAYKIKYTISPYSISSLESEYFPDPVFRGLHKRYNYWFTGLNKEILNFEQNYNYMYRAVISGSVEPGEVKQATNNQDIIKRTFQPLSDQSNQGAAFKTNEPAANAADSLYNFGDLARIKLRIIGDPAYLQQGEVAEGISEKTFTFNPFNDDGTINFEAGDVVFDVTWNSPQDYNLSTGLADPVAGNSGGKATGGTGLGGAAPTVNATYYAVSCKSIFRNGRFEQELEGSLLTSNPKYGSNQKDNGRPSADADAQPGGFYGNSGSRSASQVAIDPSIDPATTAPVSPLFDEFAGYDQAVARQNQSNAPGPVSLEGTFPEPAPENPTSNGSVVADPAESASAPPKLPDAVAQANWAQYQTRNIGNISGDTKITPTADTDPQLMNREF